MLKVDDSNERAVSFCSAAEKSRLIADEDSVPVVVRYRGRNVQSLEIDQLLAMLRRDGLQRWLMRRLQRYTVNLPRRRPRPCWSGRLVTGTSKR